MKGVYRFFNLVGYVPLLNALNGELVLLENSFLPSQENIRSEGIIGFHGLRIECIVGIYPEERKKTQSLIVDLKIKYDFSACLKSGKINDSVNYVDLADLCTNLAINNHYFLLETFATSILDQCFTQFKASWAWVSIKKPSAIQTAEYAFVECERNLRGKG